MRVLELIRQAAAHACLVLRRFAGPALGTLLFGVLPLAAQTVREQQVPLDPERGVVEVDPQLRRELGLFPDLDGFESARLFRQDDGTLVLEITRVVGGTLTHERRRLDDAEVAGLRGELATRMAALGRTRAVDRSGRSGLVLTESLLGLAVYGLAVPRGFDIDSDRGRVAAYLLTAGLSYYLPYRITRNAPVSVVERDAAVWGATRGIVHGAMLGRLLVDPDANSDTEDAVQALSILGTSVAETVIGYQSVDALDATEGDVAFWGAAGDFGIPYGFGLAYLAGLFDRDVQQCDPFGCFVVDDFRWKRSGMATALAASLAAPVLAHGSGLGARYTIGDARALRSFGVLGAQVALVPAWAAFHDDEDDDLDKPAVAALLVGSAAGLWIGDRVLDRRSLSGGDGLLVMAGHVAGGLGALGVTYLLAGSDADALVYLSTSAIGSVAGSLLTVNAVSGSGRTAGPAVGARFELTPAGALLTLLPGASGRGRPIRAPLLTLRF